MHWEETQRGKKVRRGSQEYKSHSQMSEEQDFNRASAAAEDETERGEKLQPMVSFYQDDILM